MEWSGVNFRSRLCVQAHFPSPILEGNTTYDSFRSDLLGNHSRPSGFASEDHRRVAITAFERSATNQLDRNSNNSGWAELDYSYVYISGVFTHYGNPAFQPFFGRKPGQIRRKDAIHIRQGESAIGAGHNIGERQ
jgi:hypothetical protein